MPRGGVGKKYLIGAIRVMSVDLPALSARLSSGFLGNAVRATSQLPHAGQR